MHKVFIRILLLFRRVCSLFQITSEVLKEPGANVSFWISFYLWYENVIEFLHFPPHKQNLAQQIRGEVNDKVFCPLRLTVWDTRKIPKQIGSRKTKQTRGRRNFLERVKFSQREGSPKLWVLRNFYERVRHLTASQELIPLAGQRRTTHLRLSFLFLRAFPPNFSPPQRLQRWAELCRAS